MAEGRRINLGQYEAEQRAKAKADAPRLEAERLERQAERRREFESLHGVTIDTDLPGRLYVEITPEEIAIIRTIRPLAYLAERYDGELESEHQAQRDADGDDGDGDDDADGETDDEDGEG